MSKRGCLVPLQPQPPRASYSSWPNSDKPERKQESVCDSSEDQKQHQRDKAPILLEFKEQLSFQKTLFSPATECFKKGPLFRGGFPRQGGTGVSPAGPLSGHGGV